MTLATTQQLDLHPGELWWGGAVADGQAMPFGRARHRRDLAVSAGLIQDPEAGANQSAPILVSSSGRYVWSEQPFGYSFDGSGGLQITGSDVIVGRSGNSLRSAYQGVSGVHFPGSGATPSEAMFTAPQYNTWMEMPYRPTQDAVLAYARGILDAGFPPGLLMIDDRWSHDYGTWVFDRSRFPDPRAMVDQLHAWGLPVMLWLVPFISPDSDTFRMAAREGWLIAAPGGEPVIRKWWNGYSAVPDLTDPASLAWLRAELVRLQTEVGVDGFKFDAGDLRDYRVDDQTVAPTGPTGQCEAWARFAAEFPFNELRACWKMGGQPLAQRLHDKPPHWGGDGLASLIPESIAQGLIGAGFNCPDMIGGGDVASITAGAEMDQELFVRFAQCSALFPMMQFSMAPWRVLDEQHLVAVRAAVNLRQSLLPDIMALVRHAAETAEPILRSVGYHHRGYERVHDQFLLGEDLLVAPVLERGATTRGVLIPPGRWAYLDGSVVEGPTQNKVEVSLESLPWWRRVG
ncbi:MAG: glycoside hydrolase family 31 protein [Microlunatus sp.]|nr:glycoside hydrolase family 31 protein [Microlunatus sp.]